MEWMEKNMEGKKFNSNKNFTRFYAGVMVLLLVAVSVTGVIGWTIRDPSGTTAGYWDGGISNIINSDGKTYTQTGENLINAISEVKNTNKTLYVPLGFYNIDSDVIVKNCKVIGCGSDKNRNITTQFNLTGNNSITVTTGGMFQCCNVYCPSTHGGTAVNVKGTIEGLNGVLKDVYVYKNSNSNGTGVNISAIDSHIGFSTFDEIYIRGFYTGMNIFTSEPVGSSGYINGNALTNIRIYDSISPMVLNGVRNTDAQIQGNMFTIQIEPDSTSDNSGILLRNCDYNIFHLVEWDWEFFGCSNTTLFIDSKSSYNMFTGKIYNYTDLGTKNSILYDGIYNKIFTPFLNATDTTGIKVLNTAGKGLLVENSGEVIIGDYATTVPTGNNGFGVESSGGGIWEKGHNNNAYTQIINRFYAGRGSVTVPSAPNVGDEMVRNLYYGYNGSDYTLAGREIVACNSTTADYVGGKLQWYIHDSVDGGSEIMSFYADNSYAGDSLLNVPGTVNADGFNLPTSPPSKPRVGDIYLNATTGLIGRYRNGNDWHWA